MNHESNKEDQHAITIRPASSIADYRACQQAQRKAWGITEDGYLIPVATMVGAQLHGGLVLGAFLPDGIVVAMSFAFLGRLEAKPCLYSQLTGVIPGYQSLGLGYRIKLAQREFAASEGIPLIAWAFDPLQAGNARFNLDKLGATATRFVENMYGERTDQLNFGIPTDRLIAEWPVSVEKHLLIGDSTSDLPDLIVTRLRENDEYTPATVMDKPSRSRVRVQIPSDIARLRATRPELAEAWRLAVKNAFQVAFQVGYRAVGFTRSTPSIENTGCFYVLADSAKSQND